VPVRYEPALTEAEELTLRWRIVDESLEPERAQLVSGDP
jgi:hypothetical protein